MVSALRVPALDGNIRVWSTRSRKLYRSYKDYRGAITGLAFRDNDKTLVSASKGKSIQLRNIKRRRSVKTLKTKSNVVASVTLSLRGDRLAVTDERGQIELWALSSADAQISSK